MKLTKGMKKALSLLLSAAMVVTGVNVTTNTASAADGDADATVSFEYDLTSTTNAGATGADEWNGDGQKLVINGKEDNKNCWSGPSYTQDADGKNIPKVTYFDLAKTASFSAVVATYNKPTVEVTKISDSGKMYIYADLGNGIVSKDENKDTVVKEGLGRGVELKTGKNDVTKYITNKYFAKADWGFFLTTQATAKVKVYDAAPTTKAPANTPVASATASAVATTTSAVATTAPAVTTEAPTEAPTKAPATATPEPTEKPDEENQAFLMFADKDYKWGNWNTKVCGGNGKDATITGNGTYTVSINKEDFADQEAVAAPAKGATVFGVDIMGICATQKFDASKMALSDVVVKCDGKEVKTIDFSKMYEGSIEGGKNDNYRLEIRNEWGYGDGEFATKDEFDEANPDFTFEKSLSVTFTVKGIKKGATPKDAFKTADGKYAVSKGGERAKVADAADVVKTAAPSTKPAVTTTKPAVTTKPAITTAAAVKGTSKLTVAKKLVVVAPNKSVKVAFKATKAKNTSGAAVVKATSKSKKVATVKVKGKNVIIKAPKKAVKGASTTVTLKSTKANGKAISAKIKVYVRNSAKKVKAAKKSITVKKGKTTKLVVKASKVQNKKKAFADTITVKGKVLKLTAVKYAKGKATLTLKGAKKAKKKVVKIKVGKKTVKVKATVK